jgi:RNA polymerase sigma-70 factor (ECF subfamily)
MQDKFKQYDDDKLFYLLNKKNKESEYAFQELYERHSPRVYAYCRRFLGSEAEAQDVFQETFVRFYQSANKDRVMTNTPAFLLRIARNLCVNAVRKDKGHSTFEEYMVGEKDPHTSGDAELLDLIKDAISKLDEKYREMFILREYDGLSYADIADVTGEPVSTVKVRIHRAKQKVREILQPYIVELSKFS